MAKQPHRAMLAIALALGASAVLAMAWRLLRSPAPQAARSELTLVRAADGEGRALTQASAEVGRSAADAPAQPASDAPAVGAASAESAPRAGEAKLAVWGFVRDAESGAGLAECEVRLGDAEPALTDAAGRFTVQLDPGPALGTALQVARVERRPREVLFAGSVLLQPGMEILVQPPIALRGRLVDPDGRPVRASGVAAYLEPERLREVEWFLASTDAVAEDGRFEIRARAPSAPPPALELRIGIGSSIVETGAAWSELCSEEGATVLVDVCTVRLSFVESDGITPVAEGELRLAAWSGADPDPSLRVYADLASVAPLALALPRTATEIELAIGAPFHAPTVARREAAPCGGTWIVALARLGSEDVIEGRVLDPGGQPVAGAFASCNPCTRDGEVGVAAHNGVRTDSEGRFALPFQRGQSAELRAHHRDHGLTPERTVAGGSRDVVLRFLGVQEVTVDARFPAAAQVAASAHPFEWVLALQDGSLHSGSERASPFVIEEVPPGDHRLFVLALDGAWFAQGLASVYPALDARVELELEPARRVRGRVRNADGTPARGVAVASAEAAWPEPLARTWGSTETGPDGSFALLAGLATEVDLVLERGGAELLRVRAVAAEANEIRLP